VISESKNINPMSESYLNIMKSMVKDINVWLSTKLIRHLSTTHNTYHVDFHHGLASICMFACLLSRLQQYKSELLGCLIPTTLKPGSLETQGTGCARKKYCIASPSCPPMLRVESQGAGRRPTHPPSTPCYVWNRSHTRFWPACPLHLRRVRKADKSCGPRCIHWLFFF
jgi:hypothetical protein